MDITNHAQNPPAPLRIVVIGAGIAGAEAALTMAIGLPSADVVLIGPNQSISMLPNLVYVPFGVLPSRTDIDVANLLAHGVRHHAATVEWVDPQQRIVRTSDGDVAFDVLVAAPGAQPRGTSTNALRSMDDAIRVREALTDLVDRARHGDRATITLRAEADDSWTAPACELAILIGTWLRAARVDSQVEVLLATADSQPFEWFGTEGAQIVEGALRRARVGLATGVPVGRFDGLEGDLVIEFGPMQARVVDGLPGLGTNGWYAAGPDLQVAPGIFVVGDAVDLPYRAGFATAWQARRVLRVLGGSVERLGTVIDGIPTGSVEYQMDLGDGVLRARVGNADTLSHPFLGHDADVWSVAGARPDKLAGLVLHDRVVRWRGVHDAALSYRDKLRTQTELVS